MSRFGKIRKALTAALISSALLAGAFPVFTDAVRADDLGLWIGDEKVTYEHMSGTGWSYDDDTNTLTLDNYSNSGEQYCRCTAIDEWNIAGIVYKGTDELTIYLAPESTNMISGYDSTEKGSYGIYSEVIMPG